jgi:hypothetical protein
MDLVGRLSTLGASAIFAFSCAVFFAGAPVARGQAFQSEATIPTASAGQSSPLAAPNSPNESAPYQPITPRQRLDWLLADTVGPAHLATGVFTAGLGTALDRPKEYGSGWPGFGKRYGMRMTGTATGNVMEAGAGALWGEDPRYFRAPEKQFGARVGNVIKQTFLARRRDGSSQPAYARFLAIPGNNFLSNTWRADSEADNPHAAVRTLEGFAGRMASNAFKEFWPDVKRRLFHRK